jgi:hypothetical protein
MSYEVLIKLLFPKKWLNAQQIEKNVVVIVIYNLIFEKRFDAMN